MRSTDVYKIVCFLKLSMHAQEIYRIYQKYFFNYRQPIGCDATSKKCFRKSSEYNPS